jgi:hypothetical protein
MTMPTCRQATRLISDGLDHPLSWTVRLALALHLIACGPCRRFRWAVRWLHRTLASPPADVRLPAEARQRIRRALERAAGEE